MRPLEPPPRAPQGRQGESHRPPAPSSAGSLSPVGAGIPQRGRTAHRDCRKARAAGGRARLVAMATAGGERGVRGRRGREALRAREAGAEGRRRSRPHVGSVPARARCAGGARLLTRATAGQLGPRPRASWFGAAARPDSCMTPPAPPRDFVSVLLSPRQGLDGSQSPRSRSCWRVRVGPGWAPAGGPACPRVSSALPRRPDLSHHPARPDVAAESCLRAD